MGITLSTYIDKESNNIKFDMSDTLYPPRTVRERKGKSIIAFPESYCVIDIETTGLSPAYDNIIEISAIKVSSNNITDTFSSLVQPYSTTGEYVDEYITALTGITNEMLSTAPSEKEVITQFRNFVDSSILIGHNVHFDINFLYDSFENYLDTSLSNDFIDTMRISRKLHSDLPHHRLSDIAKFYGIDYSTAHRALSDCMITHNCYLQLCNEIITKYESLDSFLKNVKHYYSGVKAKDIQTTTQIFDESNMIYGKVIVFTGTLEKMTRREAMQLVANLGGINGDNVTKKTNYLILGNNDYCTLIKDGKSNKQKKSEQLKLQGHDIEIIPESVFYDMLPEIQEEDTCSSIDTSDTKIDDNSFQTKISSLLQDIITEMELPKKGLVSQKNSGKSKETFSIYINEPPYPATEADLEKINTTQSILNYEEKEDSVILTVKTIVFNELDCPSDIQYKYSDTKKKAFVKMYFPLNHPELYTYIKNAIYYRIKHYISASNPFGCCSKFVECSDAKKCLHENKLYSTSCIYRRNLENGKIFYGKNRNID